MKIKRYFAPDMRRAIRMVRDEQGPDAVILSSRNLNNGVELVAAVDYDAELVSGMCGAPAEAAPATPVAPAASPAEETKVSVAPDLQAPHQPAAPERRATLDELLREPPQPAVNRFSFSASPPRGASTSGARNLPGAADTARTHEQQVEWVQDPALVAMQEELKTLRAILQDQVARLATSDYDRREPVRAEIVRRMVRFGFDEVVARGIAAGTAGLATQAEAWREAIFRLAKRLPVAATDPLEQGGVIALVGATGVGKTTTAAKLAARACVMHGQRSVALVSTDDFRVGAQRQLASFGLLLGLPVRQARSPAELAEQLAELCDRHLVIVDTAGVGQRDLRLIEETRKLTGVPDLRSYLVLSANVQREVMDQVVEAFGRERLAGCILTKLDETALLGPALSALLSHQLPAIYSCGGQRVPEDLAIARSRDLVTRALSLPSPVRPGAGPPPTCRTRGEVRHAAV